MSKEAYKLYGVKPTPGKDTVKMKNARGLFAKKVKNKTEDGHTYELTPMETNKVYNDLSNSHLTESIKKAVLKQMNKKIKLNEVDDDTADYLSLFYDKVHDYVEEQIKSLKDNIGNYSSTEYIEGAIDALEELYEYMNNIE